MSIFTDTSIRRLEDAANTHVFNVAAGVASSAAHTGSYHVIAAGSCLADDSTAVFAIALQNAGLLIVKLPVIGSRGDVIKCLLITLHKLHDCTVTPASPALVKPVLSQIFE